MTDWVALWGDADVPVLRQTARELERLQRDERLFNAHTMANVITDDPLMTLKLLRYMQRRKHRNQQYELVDVKQALLMIGLETYLREVPAAPFVEDQLHDHRAALVCLLHTVSRAQRAAHYAYDWALRLHDLHADEVLVSALLTHVSEMLMWCFNPVQMLEIRRRQQADPALRSADVQREVMGFTGLDLQRELVRAWHLPELLQNLMDPARAQSTRVRNVMLAVNLARHSAHGWDDAALPDDYRDIGALLRMDAEAARRLVQSGRFGHV